MLNEITVKGDLLELKLKKRFATQVEKEFNDFNLSINDGYVTYTFKQFPNVSFVLKAILDKFGNVITATPEAKSIIETKASIANQPMLSLFKTGKHVEITCPPISHYTELIDSVGAGDKGFGTYTVPIARAFDVIRAAQAHVSFLPPFRIDELIQRELVKPIKGFENTIHSAFTTKIDDINAANKAYQIKLERFNDAGYVNITDFLLQKPLRYIDKTQISDFSDLEFKEPVTFIGKIVKKDLRQFKHTVIHLEVNGRVFQITYWNRGWVYDNYNIGDEVLIMGDYQRGNFISGNSIDYLLEAKSLDIVPIYPQSPKNKITTKVVMNNVYEIIERLAPYVENLTPYISQDDLKDVIYTSSEETMTLGRAIREMHFPSSSYQYLEALETLAFYELMYLQLMIMHRKETEVKSLGLRKPQVAGGYMDKMIASLPWSLTPAQEQGVEQFNHYLGSDTSEQVLLSAEVGSGKTVLAQLACMQALDNGYQSVLAGPTEVLAQQLYDGFVEAIERMPSDSRPTIAYLGGGVKAAEKREILKFVKSGDIDILIGTHSVLSKKIEYHNIGLVVVDEQQKFGKEQREALLDVRADGRKPDLIAQTATPIPRSTAQAFYGDIDIVQLEGKPPGRIEVETLWVQEDPRKVTKDANHEMWKDIKEEIDKGHQVFVVVPMVYDSKSMNASSVEGTYKDLSKIMPGVNIGYMHGQLKKADQKAVMDRFRNNEDQVLIGSTVIEVGVNIPNATRIVILSADRMGASSLHQIRGRVGRSNLPSKAYLVSEGKRKASQVRLQALVDTNNGFEIATIDMKTRGEGDLFGVKQAGESSLMFATLVDHSKLISRASEVAKKIYEGEYKELALKDAQVVVTKRELEEEK